MLSQLQLKRKDIESLGYHTEEANNSCYRCMCTYNSIYKELATDLMCQKVDCLNNDDGNNSTGFIVTDPNKLGNGPLKMVLGMLESHG